MSEPLSNDGNPKNNLDIPAVIKVKRGRPRKGAGRPKGKQFEPVVDGTIKTVDGLINLPEIDRTKVNTSKISLQVIPPGPYTTTSQLWNAVFLLQTINIERTTLGIKPISDYEINRHLQIKSIEVERIIQSDEYRKFRISKSAGVAQQTIADIVPSLRVAMVEFMSQLKIMKKCETCGRVGLPSLEKLHEGLKFVVYAMDKFGLPKIDTSLAENSDEMDTEQVIEEGIALAKEIVTWPNLAPQRIIAALVDPGSNSKTTKTKQNQKPLESGTDNRPDEVVHSVRLPETVIPKQEKISGDDIEQSLRQNRLADSGLHSGGTGETPHIQNAEERNTMDFSGEERQDSASVGTEVSGETGAERIQMGIQ